MFALLIESGFVHVQSMLNCMSFNLIILLQSGMQLNVWSNK